MTDPSLRRMLTLRRDESRRAEPIWEIPVESICRSFKFKISGEPVLVKNAPDADAKARLQELGRLLAQAHG